MKLDTNLPQVKRAQGLAKYLADDGRNPPVAVKVHCNGPRHRAVVHVTYGEPRTVVRDTTDGGSMEFTPERPAPYTISIEPRAAGLPA